MRHLILGTAGHIDHGKTSLVRRLTGIDTDRLPEEKKRGITIDLGFANLDLPGVRLGIVDVPGHERFIHNMVAGATGMDLIALVVAADDSIMPQTTEHLAILQLLGIERGLVVVTKIDLVDAGYLDLVREELSDFLRGSFLEGAPVVPVSSVTGVGIDALKLELAKLAEGYNRPRRSNVFRLPVDRAFTIAGHGTVVTGTVVGGSAETGTSAVLMPAGQTVRLRRLQSHSAETDRIEAGQRAAVNLAGIKVEEVRRGDEVVADGYLEPSKRLFVQVRMLPTSPKPLANRQQLRLHIGTREVTVRAIVKGDPIAPGATGFAELRCAEEVMADYGQRFILRQLSPVVTVGGGQVLDPAVPPTLRIRDPAGMGDRLSRQEPAERLAAYLETGDVDSLVDLRSASRLGIDPAERAELIDNLVRQKKLVRVGGAEKILIHPSRRESLASAIVQRCERELKRRQPSRAVDRATLAASCRRLAGPTMIAAMLDDLVSTGRLVALGDKLGPPGRRASLTKNQQKLLGQIVDAITHAGATPPLIAELASQLQSPGKELETLAKVAVEDDLLIHVGDGLYYSPAALADIRTKTIARIAASGPATVADLRDLWSVSRKYAVPLCEYLDAAGITKRQADFRTLGPNATQIQPLG